MAKIQRLAFPNGNDPRKTSVTESGVRLVKSTWITQSKWSRHGNPPWEANFSLLFATPHHHRDVARFRPSYDPIPSWLHEAGNFLAEEASAVILTYPPDVEAVRTLLLPVLGFPGPYPVVPVYQKYGIETPYAEVMVIAQRPTPPNGDHFCLTVKGEMQRPADVAKRLQPRAKRALLMFAQDDSLLFDSPPHPTDIFGIRGQRPRWPGLASPSCWSAWQD